MPLFVATWLVLDVLAGGLTFGSFSGCAARRRVFVTYELDGMVCSARCLATTTRTVSAVLPLLADGMCSFQRCPSWCAICRVQLRSGGGFVSFLVIAGGGTMRCGLLQAGDANCCRPARSRSRSSCLCRILAEKRIYLKLGRDGRIFDRVSFFFSYYRPGRRGGLYEVLLSRLR